jgi:hypothetical protein
MIPIYTIQAPLHNSRQQLRAPRLTRSQQQRTILHEMHGKNQMQQQPFYNTYQMHQSNQSNASINTVLYPPPGTAGIRHSPNDSQPASMHDYPMKYPYYPEILPEEPAFMPAPPPSMLLCDRNFYYEQNFSPVYRSHEPTKPPAPQLKSIYLKKIAADACCSTGVAVATLALSLILFVIFVVVAIQLGRHDNFCDGYVGSIPFDPTQVYCRLTLSFPPCVLPVEIRR